MIVSWTIMASRQPQEIHPSNSMGQQDTRHLLPRISPFYTLADHSWKFVECCRTFIKLWEHPCGAPFCESFWWHLHCSAIMVKPGLLSWFPFVVKEVCYCGALILLLQCLLHIVVGSLPPLEVSSICLRTHVTTLTFTMWFQKPQF